MILRSWWSWLQQKHNPDHPVHVLFRRSHIKYHWQLNWQIGLFNFPLVGGRPTPLKNMKVNGKDYPIYYGKSFIAQQTPATNRTKDCDRWMIRTHHSNRPPSLCESESQTRDVWARLGTIPGTNHPSKWGYIYIYSCNIFIYIYIFMYAP